MTTPITPDERAEWRALADAATQWPWETTQNDLTDEIGVVHDQEYRVEVAFTGMPYERGAQADADFIAAARTAVPRLLDALDTAEAEAARATDAARLYGRIVEQQCIDIAKITRSEHLVTEDGDADWAAIWDRGHELADRAEKAEAEAARLRAAHDLIASVTASGLDVRESVAALEALAARPAPVWDEDTMTEAVASALADHRPDLDETAVFTGECDCGWRTPGPAWAASEEEHRPHVATAVLAVVREHLPVFAADIDGLAFAIFEHSHEPSLPDDRGGMEEARSRALDYIQMYVEQGESRAAVQAEALRNAAADEYEARLPDGTGNGRAYNSYTVAAMLRARADRLAKGADRG